MANTAWKGFGTSVEPWTDFAPAAFGSNWINAGDGEEAGEPYLLAYRVVGDRVEFRGALVASGVPGSTILTLPAAIIPAHLVRVALPYRRSFGNDDTRSCVVNQGAGVFVLDGSSYTLTSGDQYFFDGVSYSLSV